MQDLTSTEGARRLASEPGGERAGVWAAGGSMRRVVLLTFALAAACNNGSASSESLYVQINGSNPSHQNAPQTISVTVILIRTIQYTDSYSNARSSPLAHRSPASSSETSTPVVPDALSLTLDGQPVPCSPGACAHFWDTSNYPDGTHVFEATAHYKSLSGTSTWTWVLDRRPATIQPLGVPPSLSSGGSAPRDLAVGFGPADAPLVLSTQLAVPDVVGGVLGLAQWIGGSWQVTPLGSTYAITPTLTLTATGEIWAGWDDAPAPRVVRSDGGGWEEELNAGPTALPVAPRLASNGSDVVLASIDPAALVRRFRGGAWDALLPDLGLHPDAARVGVDRAGTIYLALEVPSGNLFVRVLRIAGASWEQLGEDFSFEPWDAGTLYVPRHLVDLVIDGESRAVIGLADAKQITIDRWNGTGWQMLGQPRHPYDDSAGSFGYVRPPAAIAAVPDGGLGVLYVSASGTLTLDGWDGAEWQTVFGPLRAAGGTAHVSTPALAYDATGWALAAWQQLNWGVSGPQLVMWRP